MGRRRRITKDMLIAAREHGWHATLTAANYGVHRSTIRAACELFGVELPMHKFSPQRVSKRSGMWAEIVGNGKNPRIRLSASPDAIARALKKLDARRKSMARGV